MVLCPLITSKRQTKAIIFAKLLTALDQVYRLSFLFRFKVLYFIILMSFNNIQYIVYVFYTITFNIFFLAPPQFEIKLRNQTARRGEPAVLQCEAQGEKPIGILWNMNNKRLDTKSDPRYTIREEILANGVLSDLSIKRTERSDSALFTCVATNAFGSDDTSINMIVQGWIT